MNLRVWALSALVMCSTAAFAQECPLPPEATPALAASDTATRLNFLRLSLNQDARLATRWRWGWVLGFGFVGAFNLGNSFSGGPALETQSADYVGLVTSGISIIPLVVKPLKVTHDGPAFDSRVAAAGPSDTCELVAQGEKLLELDAENEHGGVSWVIQTANVVVNLVAGAVIGFGYHSWSSAGITAGVGLVLGEAMIQTQPTGLIRDLNAYNHGELGPGSEAKPTAIGFSIHPAGTGVAGTF